MDDNFIKLTLATGNDLFIRKSEIVGVTPSTDGKTAIWMPGAENWCCVKETVSEVLKLLGAIMEVKV
ncbi:MAG: hypothetical protein II897_04150 [Clostridia bacterium]|nr:hypothetical protein [Clostridia bacterium]